MTASPTELMLKGYGLTTAEMIYRMPDHTHVLNTFLWQEYDLAPDYPHLFRVYRILARRRSTGRCIRCGFRTASGCRRATGGNVVGEFRNRRPPRAGYAVAVGSRVARKRDNPRPPAPQAGRGFPRTPLGRSRGLSLSRCRKQTKNPAKMAGLKSYSCDTNLHSGIFVRRFSRTTLSPPILMCLRRSQIKLLVRRRVFEAEVRNRVCVKERGP